MRSDLLLCFFSRCCWRECVWRAGRTPQDDGTQPPGRVPDQHTDAARRHPSSNAALISREARRTRVGAPGGATWAALDARVGQPRKRGRRVRAPPHLPLSTGHAARRDTPLPPTDPPPRLRSSGGATRLYTSRREAPVTVGTARAGPTSPTAVGGCGGVAQQYPPLPWPPRGLPWRTAVPSSQAEGPGCTDHGCRHGRTIEKESQPPQKRTSKAKEGRQKGRPQQSRACESAAQRAAKEGGRR